MGLSKKWKRALGTIATGGLYDVGRAVGKGLKAGEAGYDQAAGTIGGAYANARGMLQPYNEYGVQSLADLKKFTTGDPTQAVTSDPTYQFGFNQGSAALNNSAASRNGLLSGRAMKEMMQFGQDYGASKYDQILNRKMGLADFGFRTGAGTGADLAIGEGNALAGIQAEKGKAKAGRYQGLLSLGANIGGKLFGGM